MIFVGDHAVHGWDSTVWVGSREIHRVLHSAGGVAGVKCLWPVKLWDQYLDSLVGPGCACGSQIRRVRETLRDICIGVYVGSTRNQMQEKQEKMKMHHKYMTLKPKN